jgi:hypothetical protein
MIYKNHSFINPQGDKIMIRAFALTEKGNTINKKGQKELINIIRTDLKLTDPDIDIVMGSLWNQPSTLSESITKRQSKETIVIFAYDTTTKPTMINTLYGSNISYFLLNMENHPELSSWKTAIQMCHEMDKKEENKNI